MQRGLKQKKREMIGRLDRRITLLQETVNRGSSGGENLTYEELATVSARVEFPRIEREENEGARRTGFLQAEFTIRYRTDLDNVKRVRYQGKEYDIETVNELMEQRRCGYLLIRAIYRS